MSDTTKSVDDELMRIVWHALAEQMTHGTNCKDAEHIEQRSCVDFTKKTFDKTIEAITQLFTKQLEEAEIRARTNVSKIYEKEIKMLRRFQEAMVARESHKIEPLKLCAICSATLTQDAKGGKDERN